MWGSGKRWERGATRADGAPHVRVAPRPSPALGAPVNYTSSYYTSSYAPGYTAYASAVQAPVRPRVDAGRRGRAGRSDQSWQQPTGGRYDSSQELAVPEASYPGMSYPGATGARRAASARPVTREQRLTVIEHTTGAGIPDEFAGEIVEEMALVVGGAQDVVPEFSQQLDFLIAASTAQHQVVLPRPKPPKVQRAARGIGAAAALTTRAGLGFLILVAIMTAITALTGHPPIPVQALALPGLSQVDGGSYSQWTADTNVVGRVQPFTQMHRADLYDNKDQFNAWGGSACSAAVLAEILTAYGVQHATIGSMIDELGSSISQKWGLVSYDGFGKVAALHGLRADTYLDHPLTYKQMQYITNTLGLPLIVNVRATTGYYHYLSGGHFLVMTGGDDKTIHLVDSSLYYIKSLPMSTFMGMYRNRSVVIVPKDYHYTLPA